MDGSGHGYDDGGVDAFTAFYAANIPPGEDGLIVNAVTDDSDSEDDAPLPYTEVKKTVITMLALPHDAAEGDHTVYIDRPDPLTGEISTFALCTLNKKRCPHVRTETMFIDSPVRMFHTGESVVSVTGYDTVEIMGYGAGDDSEDSEEEYDYGKALLGDSDGSGDDSEGDSGDDSEDDSEESEDDEESSDDDDAPELVGLSIPSASEDDSILEADVEDSDLDVELGDIGADISTGDDSDSSESDDDDDDDSGDSKDSDDSDDSDGSSDDDESMDIASDSDDEDEREAMKRRLKTLSTPQPAAAKKQKLADGAKVPASAPAKVSNPRVPTNEAEYEAALRTYIQQNGGKDGVPMSQLGNVKRPAAVSRLKKYLEANKDKFAVNKATNTVTLA